MVTDVGVGTLLVSYDGAGKYALVLRVFEISKEFWQDVVLVLLLLKRARSRVHMC